MQEKIKRDRSISGKKGGLILAKSGFLKKIQPLAAKAAAIANVKDIPNSARHMSELKAKLLGYCMFDGSVVASKRYNVVSYSSKFKEQVENFADLTKKIYGFWTSVRNKLHSDGSNIFYCRFCSRKLIEDLRRYTPSFSTRATSNAKVPNEILNGPKSYKIAFLQAFWDDEGAVFFYARKDRAGYTHKLKKLEGYSESLNVLWGLAELHMSLGINIQKKRNRIIISGKDDLLKFRKLINFSPYARVGREVSSWYSIPKKYVLEFALRDFDRPIKIFIKTYGCTSNIADSDVMRGILFSAGFDVVETENEADIIIVNSCSVKNPTEIKILKYINELPKHKKVILAGCLTNTLENITQKLPNVEGFLEANQPTKIIQKITSVYYDYSFNEEIKNNPERVAKLSVLRINQLIAAINISYGCLSACSYCSTKKARGILHSFPICEIYNQVEKALDHGAEEIRLTSQDNSIYGFDIGTNIVELLKQIISIPKEFKIRIGMSNPKYLLKFLDDLIEVYKNDKLYKFLHIPLQSGSDNILKVMNRGYVADDFVKIIKKFKKEIPEITISTDIICGFPGETKEDFDETIKIIEEIKPDIINISRFWPRPGTKAAEMKQIEGREIKERTRKLTELYNNIALENNKKWLNWQGKIYITEKGKDTSYLGRNFAYKQVVVKGNIKIGQEVNVKIKDISPFDLKGEVL